MEGCIIKDGEIMESDSYREPVQLGSERYDFIDDSVVAPVHALEIGIPGAVECIIPRCRVYDHRERVDLLRNAGIPVSDDGRVMHGFLIAFHDIELGNIIYIWENSDGVQG